VNTELDELYLTWLYSQVGSVTLKNPSRTYWSIFRLLYRKEFVWFVPNDDNRAEDGKDLRYEFIDDKELEDVSLDWMNLGCSVFELLIGLSRRLAFEAGGEPLEWFWEFMENLEFRAYNDKSHIPTEEIEAALDQVIWRTYNPDGAGGLFPLRYPERDQRDIEIWYQMSAYLKERE
jgi:hypothetical protein